MSIIVQKFGGTSVSNTSRIKNVASIVTKEVAKGNKVVVVVSAMSGVTDDLIGKIKKLSHLKNLDQLIEHDVVLSSGEQISAALVSLAIQNMGYKSRSWLAWQLPIVSDSNYTKARITSINTEKILQALANDEIPVITGFQCIDSNNRITTLGRGGSDTTATAVAAALSAARCDIYTDVTGVFSADPRIVKNAKKLDKISYEEMLELSSLGAKVLNARSVETAMKHKLQVRVLSSFEEDSGTMLITDAKSNDKEAIIAIAQNRHEVKITVVSISEYAKNLILNSMDEYDIHIDMVSQNANNKNIDFAFTVTEADVDKTVAIIENYKDNIKYTAIDLDKSVSKVSIVGPGVKTRKDLVMRVQQILTDKKIDTITTSTSDTKLSILIHDEYTELAIRTLHANLGLEHA